MSVRRSASGDIRRPDSFSRADTKSSMDFTGPKSFRTGCTDQWSSRGSRRAAWSAAFSGQTAPSAIHCRTFSVWADVSGSPLGGIFFSSSCVVMRSKSKDLVGSPATKAGPDSPPLSACGLASRRRLAFTFFGPWHSTHRSCNSGRISRSKSTAAPRPAAASNRAARASGLDMGRAGVAT